MSDPHAQPHDAYESYTRDALAAVAVSRGYLAVAIGLPLQFLTEIWLRRIGYFADDAVLDAGRRYLGAAALGLLGYGLSRTVPAARRHPFIQGNVIAFGVSAMLGRAAYHAGGAESPYVVSLCTLLFCWSLIMPGGVRYAVVPIVGGLVTFYGVLYGADPNAAVTVRGLAFALFTTTSAGFALVYAEVLERWRRQVTTSSTTDALTGVANRATLLERLHRIHDEAREAGRPVSVLMIDLDHFKQVNDTFGHAVGDEVLRTVAAELSRATERGATCGRLGGEEFVLVLDACDGTRAHELAERLRARIESIPFRADGDTFTVSISVGVSCLDEGGPDTPSAALGAADRALYESKGRGRNCVTLS